MSRLSFVDTVLGRPLATEEEDQQRLGVLAGIPVFGLDAMSSAAYGPEAALTVLLPLSAAGAVYILPITGAICVLLAIVYLSYRQTIAAYPSGGGSYTVAHENLGAQAGLLAAAALMIDYLLNVAVGISAGVGAIISAVPMLQPYTLSLCLVILLILTIVNLRGMREAGVLFMIPTCFFVGTLFAMIVMGIRATIAAHGHPRPVVAPPACDRRGTCRGAMAFVAGLRQRLYGDDRSRSRQQRRAGLWRACSDFRAACAGRDYWDPGVVAGGDRLSLACLWYCRDGAGKCCVREYSFAVACGGCGQGNFLRGQYVSIVLVLCLSANTSFADFPRLCRAVAEDGYLPRAFANRGRRLVYSEGICVLSALAALLLIMFDGITDNLIPLFAVGAFLAFTLSQAGMVAHWSRSRIASARSSMLINGLGTVATAITTIVVVVAKFTQGAWIVVLLAPALILIMRAVHRHYRDLDGQTAAIEDFEPAGARDPLVVVLIDRWSRISRRALRFAVTMSDEITALHVECDRHTTSLRHDWHKFVQEPARRANRPVPQLVRAQVAVPIHYQSGRQQDPGTRRGESRSHDRGNAA